MAVSLLISTIAVLIFDATDFDTAVERRLRALHYTVSGDRPRDASVIFVAIDEWTTEAWGPPPWTWSRFQRLIEAVRQANPKAIALLEPGVRAQTDEPMPKSMRPTFHQPNVFFPPSRGDLAPPKVLLDRAGTTEWIRYDPGAPSSVTTRLLKYLKMGSNDRELFVRFRGGPESLPTLPAHHVEEGTIPPDVFHDAVVIIGFRSDRFTSEVATPVGKMSPAEVHAHAIASALLDGRIKQLSPPYRYVFALFGFALAALFASGLSFRAIGGAAVLFLLGGAALDYVLLVHGGWLVGISLPLFAALLGGLSAWHFERVVVTRSLGGTQRRLSEKLDLSEDAEFDRGSFIAGAAAQLEAQSMLLGSLPEEQWHVQLGHYWNTAEEEIEEPRRDIRRSPYKEAFLHLRPSWSTRPFMRGDLSLKTLIVPLVSGNTLYGFWMLNYLADEDVSERETRLINLLAQHAGQKSKKTKLRRKPLPRGDFFFPARVVRLAEQEAQDTQDLFDLQQEQQKILTSLPSGLLTANVWGGVEQVSEIMRRFLSEHDIARPTSLPALLTALTGLAPPEVRELLQTVATTKTVCRVACKKLRKVGTERHLELLITRPDVIVGGPSSELDASTFYLVTLTHGIESQLPLSDWSWRIRSA